MKKMDEVDSIFGGYDKDGKLTKSKAFPFMCHCVVNFISAKDAYQYIIKNGLKVTERTVVTWRRNAAEWLGLAQPNRGRANEAQSRELRQKWHRVNGYPTFQDFFNGWVPVHLKQPVAEQQIQSQLPVSQPNSHIPQPMQEVDKETKNDKSEGEVPRPRKRTTKKKTAAKSPPPIIDFDEIERPQKEVIDVSEFLNGGES